MAVCEEKHSKPPVVTEGDLTPEVLQNFVDYSMDFFQNKDVAEADQVRRVYTAFKDHRIRDWIAAERGRILGLSFEEFVMEIKEKYLAPDWEEELRIRIYAAIFDPAKKTFWNFACQLQKLNSLLVGTGSYLDNDSMRTQLEVKMDPSLRQLYKSEKLSSEKDFQKWLESIRLIDNTRHFSEKRQREIADEAVRAAKKPLLSSSKHNASSQRANSGSASASSLATPRVPALTTDERKLLGANEGCFKCRIPFAGHLSRDCKNGFPDASNYKPVTQAVVDAHKALHARASKPSHSKPLP